MKRRSLWWVGTGVLGCAVVAAGVVGIGRLTAAKESSAAVDSRLVSANTGFGFKLFGELVKEEPKSNVFISPASVALALSMTYNGAAGGTRQAMAKALELRGMSLGDVNKANAALLANLQAPGPGVKLAIADSLWARKGIRFKPDFMQRNKDYYRAQVTSLDFTDPRAPSTINAWVSRKTQGKIKEIVQRINPAEILFLINAVYFKGTWARKFDKANTKEGTFTLPGGRKKRVMMMSRTGKCKYYAGQNFEAISLPYGQGRVSMYIFLPNKNSSLSVLYKELNAKNWETWVSGFQDISVHVVMPRFKLEYETELKRALTALGMGIAFDGPRADFSAMCPIPPMLPVYVSKVRHKTFVEVNEEGTEAAAVTSVGMAGTGMPTPPLDFIVDRPFFCAIRDNKTGTILFMGSIVEPK